MLTDEQIYELRMNTCNKCDKLNQNVGLCSLCGCFVKIKGKFKEQKCPLHKWEKNLKIAIISLEYK